ncbi:MAG: hypothetical protein R3330_03670, partial [Saprospiraceae bacterium]|nr:hypothetical protein [Saprospiraceae bacterium]
ARAETTGVALTLIDTETMQKFARIERLIEREVPKAPLPPELGDGPEWDPNRRPSKSRGRDRGGKRSPRKDGRKRGPRGKSKGKGGKRHKPRR